MSEILNRAKSISEEQTEAKEVASAKKLQMQEELYEKQLAGTERARQFAQLMQKNNIPTERFYTSEHKVSIIFGSDVYKQKDIGSGWSVQDFKPGYDESDTRGIAILEDSSVLEWGPDYQPYKKTGRKIVTLNNRSELLCSDDGLEILGKKVVDLGIIK